jgi:hypothetical protein
MRLWHPIVPATGLRTSYGLNVPRAGNVGSDRVTVSGSLPPNIDRHDLVEGDRVLAQVVELGGAGGGMRRHLARLIQRAAVLPLVTTLRCSVTSNEAPDWPTEMRSLSAFPPLIKVIDN